MFDVLCYWIPEFPFGMSKVKSIYLSLSLTPRRAASRCWRPSTRLCRTTTSTWRAPCSSPTWSPPDTPAPGSTAPRRLPWRPSPPCAAPCPPQCRVRLTLNGCRDGWGRQMGWCRDGWGMNGWMIDGWMDGRWVDDSGGERCTWVN